VTVDGVLVVDKPVGITSFDVVRKVRRAARERKVGHGGTLDPLASGVLPVCLGEATKLAPFLLDANKTYDVTVCLGVETDTDDADGTVTARQEAAAVDAAAVRVALAPFRGTIQQVPPIYSALKRAGRPLYEYARAGEAVTIEARTVTVFELDLTAFRSPASVDLHVACSKGTYVRALARDLGRALGVGGHVTALRRVRSGPFSLAGACSPDEAVTGLAAGDSAGLPLVSLADALGHIAASVVSDEVARDLRLGRRVPWITVAGTASMEPGRRRVLDGAGALVTVAEPRPDGTTSTLRVFGIPH
jgi:tRNA pseudouridine55 synthase